jgi:hypothetical protein
MDVLAVDWCAHLSQELGLLDHSELRLPNFDRKTNFLATVVVPGVMHDPEEKFVINSEVCSHDCGFELRCNRTCGHICVVF